MIKVIITFESESRQQEHLIDDDRLDDFMTAMLKLHHDPGINPYTKGKTYPIVQIAVVPLQEIGPYWWTSPSLQDSDPRGVTMYCFDSMPTIVWKRPEQS